MPRIKIVDNTIFGDVWVNKSGVRKIKKYIMLKDEIAKMWSMKKVTVIPIVVGALVAISTGSEKYLNWVWDESRTCTGNSLMGTISIFRMILGC